jgi:hypothetical protein
MTCKYVLIFGKEEPSLSQPPLLEECEDDSHSRNGDLGVLRVSWNFRVRLQGSKHLALGCSLYRWKALKESYKFASDLVPIEGLSKEVWPREVLEVQTETISRQFRDSTLGIPGQRAIQVWVRRSNAKNTIWGKVVASPESGPWWVKWVRVAYGLSQHQKWFRRCTNQLVGWFF